MDVSIGHLRLAGRVVGSPDRDATPGVVDLLTGPAAREHLLTALSSAFDGEEVLVIRSLTCTATLPADARSAPTGLAGTITASAARLLRDHPTDDDWVVRFDDEAAYVASYVLDYLDGHAHRWYYDAFEPFRRRDATTDLVALLNAHRALKWRVLARVREHGDLDALLDALGERVPEVVGGSTDEGVAWSALVTTAAEIVRAAVGAGADIGGTATALAHTEPPPDWRDAASLGRAVAAATAVLLPATAGGDDEIVERLLTTARDHDWFDQDAFAGALLARRSSPAPAMEDAVATVLSTRARQVLVDLAEVVADPHLVLDPRRPASPANLVRLVTALVQVASRWDDHDLARGVVAHVLRRWEVAAPVDLRGPPPPLLPAARRDLGPPPSLPVGGPTSAYEPTPSDSPASAHEAPSPAMPQSAVEVARLLDERFPRPAPLRGLGASTTAGGLLLVRALLDLGLSPYLLSRVGHDHEPLLTALLRRWGGGPVEDDPVLAAVPGADDLGPGQLDEACALATRRLVGLRAVVEPVYVLTLPHGSAGVADVVADDTGRVLPCAPSAAARFGLELGSGPADPTRRGVLADALAAVSVGHDGPDDLRLDLLAVSCVQAWARWLPGFSHSSVPFLLATFVRRPAAVDVGDAEVTVLLPRRSHDVVLELAGYLDPVDAGPPLGNRRVRFVTGDDHGP